MEIIEATKILGWVFAFGALGFVWILFRDLYQSLIKKDDSHTWFGDAPKCYGTGEVFCMDDVTRLKCLKCKYETYCRSASNK